MDQHNSSKVCITPASQGLARTLQMPPITPRMSAWAGPSCSTYCSSTATAVYILVDRRMSIPVCSFFSMPASTVLIRRVYCTCTADVISLQSTRIRYWYLVTVLKVIVERFSVVKAHIFALTISPSDWSLCLPFLNRPQCTVSDHEVHHIIFLFLAVDLKLYFIHYPWKTIGCADVFDSKNGNWLHLRQCT